MRGRHAASRQSGHPCEVLAFRALVARINYLGRESGGDRPIAPNVMARIPENEPERLAALASYRVLDTAPEQEYDDLARLASFICGTPMALVSLVDESRQWFKAKVGVKEDQSSRDVAFCAHTILETTPFVVPDATHDARFRDNPFVTGNFNLRFYAGVPLTDDAGLAMGSLCVLDTKPRELSQAQIEALEAIGRQVVSLLVGRRRLVELEAARAEARFESARFGAFIDNGPSLAFMKNAAGAYVFANRALCEGLGRAPRAMMGLTDKDLFPSVAESLRAQDLDVIEKGESLVFDEVVPGADGERRFYTSYKFPVVGADGERFVGGVAFDVTVSRRAEIELAESEAKFRTTLDRLAEGVLLVDPASGRVQAANAAIESLLGHPREAMHALSIEAVFAPPNGHPVDDLAAIRSAVAATSRYDGGKRDLVAADGGRIPVDVRITAVPGRGQGLWAVILRDVRNELAHERELLAKQTELEEANERLRVLSATDGMTGILNWAALKERLAIELDRANRYARPLAFVILDIDHFKGYNDTFGHPAGDEVIQKVAEIFRASVRASDIVARYGGEEFAAVLPDTDASGAYELAERLRARIAAAPWQLRAVTVSVGVASRSEAMREAAAIVAAADGALYRSKRGGRNRVTVARRDGELAIDGGTGD